MIARHARHTRLVTRLVTLLCLIGLAVGCGASARTQALRTGLIALNVARDTMRATSKEHEKQIIDACNPPTCSKEQGHAELDAWRATVDLVSTAIGDGYDAILAASILDDAKSATAAGSAVTKALDLVKGMKKPPVSSEPAITTDKGTTP